MFCYYLCKHEPANYRRDKDKELCNNKKCGCKHQDYLKVFQKLENLTKKVPFNFENLHSIQFLNMIVMSKESFSNSFHRLIQSLETLNNAVLNLKEKNFDFFVFTNNSPFMKALENINCLLETSKNMYYATDIINCSSFIF